MKNSIAGGFLGSVLAFVYGIYGILHKGIYVPLKHHAGGVLLTGPAAWAAMAGVTCVLIDQSYAMFALPPGATLSDCPLPFRILRWVGFALVLGSAFLPGNQKMTSFSF